LTGGIESVNVSVGISSGNSVLSRTAPASTASSLEPLSLDAVRFVGSGLNRPECVLCTARGDIFSADWRGGVAHLLPDGTQRLYRGTAPDGRELRPNGIALNADGSFLLADLGSDRGGVYRLTRAGEVSVFLERVDGIDLPPSNFVFNDHAGRTWITISTRHIPRADAYRKDVADGFIVLVDGRGARIVADGLGYTNEAAIDPSGNWLYVNETFGRRLSRFALGRSGDLGAREVVCEFGPGTFPDGIAFDCAGGAWITSIISNRIIRVAPDGSQALFLEDASAEHIARAEQAFARNELARPHLDAVASRCLRNISSLAFGGAERTTAYLGCLLGDAIASVELPFAGHPLAHWNFH